LRASQLSVMAAPGKAARNRPPTRGREAIETPEAAKIPAARPVVSSFRRSVVRDRLTLMPLPERFGAEYPPPSPRKTPFIFPKILVGVNGPNLFGTKGAAAPLPRCVAHAAQNQKRRTEARLFQFHIPISFTSGLSKVQACARPYASGCRCQSQWIR